MHNVRILRIYTSKRLKICQKAAVSKKEVSEQKKRFRDAQKNLSKREALRVRPAWLYYSSSTGPNRFAPALYKSLDEPRAKIVLEVLQALLCFGARKGKKAFKTALEEEMRELMLRERSVPGLVRMRVETWTPRRGGWVLTPGGTNPTPQGASFRRNRRMTRPARRFLKNSGWPAARKCKKKSLHSGVGCSTHHVLKTNYCEIF